MGGMSDNTFCYELIKLAAKYMSRQTYSFETSGYFSMCFLQATDFQHYTYSLHSFCRQVNYCFFSSRYRSAEEHRYWQWAIWKPPEPAQVAGKP